MRDVVIGSVAGATAVLLMWVMRPAAVPSVPALAPAREVPAGERVMVDELARPYLPATTRPVDPVRRRLEQVIPGVNVTKVPMNKVLEYVGEASGVNLHVNWRALEAAGIDTNTPVTLNLRQLPASRVLTSVLDDVGGGNIALRYRIEEGVVEVSTAEDLSQHKVTRVYDVRDIIDDALARDRRLNGAAAKKTEDDVVKEMTTLLQDTIEGLTFDGPPFALYFAGRLIVTRPPEQQDQVLGVLTALRRGK